MNQISSLLRGLVFILAMSALSHADEPKPANTIPNPHSATQAGAPDPAEHTQHPTLQHRNPRYQLCKSDVLEISFPLTPEFNQTVTVQPDGYVTLIGAGDIHAEGDTVAEVTEAIRSAYGKILHEPIVSIHLRDFERPYFVVGGEV
jgi:polysaccharide export outer membrane protein